MKKILTIAFALLFTACNGQQRNDVEHKEFALPAIPATLQSPSERADYLLMHYWDNLDFTDTLHTADKDFMEQTFVNFLSIFPVVSPDSLPEGVNRLMNRAQADAACYSLIAGLAEKYLYDPNSPMLDEAHYLPFLTAFSRSGALDETVKARYVRQYANCMKNRPGTLAADFAFLTPDGERHTLHRVSASCILLFFYDPDCENCHATMNDLAKHPLIARLVAEKKLEVLAVYADGDPEAWKRGASHIPATWTNVYECEGKILREEVYQLRAMPTLYLLDASKHVLLKDVPADNLIAYFQQNGDICCLNGK